MRSRRFPDRRCRCCAVVALLPRLRWPPRPVPPAPGFTLTDTAGKPVKLADYRGKYVVLEWTNPECPFVQKHYVSGNMQGLQKEWGAQDVVWLVDQLDQPRATANSRRRRQMARLDAGAGRGARRPR